MPEQQKKTPCGIGVLAHVDAGKTTLSEAMLYEAGARRTLGRVDHQDAFLDTHALERARGITIFSKQALLETEHRAVTLVDTPGHVDFSAEAERIMPVLDCAVLVISGTDGVQAHTLTLWRLLERYQVPTFLFLNKMDLPGMGKEKLLAELRQQLSPACVDFTASPEEIAENAAMCDEALLENYLETGGVTEGNLRALIAGRKLFPCWDRWCAMVCRPACRTRSSVWQTSFCRAISTLSASWPWPDTARIPSWRALLSCRSRALRWL